jgi:branched-chain amino acid transport system permease protein
MLAAGLQLVFGVQKIVNLACGSFYALGAYFGITVVNFGLGAGLPGWTLLALLLIAGALMAITSSTWSRCARGRG